MRLLLDTHAILWFLEGNEALSSAARLAIEDKTNEKFISHASGWEVAIKVSLGKLRLHLTYEELFPGAVLGNGFSVLPPCFEHYRTLLGLPWYHRDPFDRLLVAQALSESLAIISKDSHFQDYGVTVLW